MVWKCFRTLQGRVNCNEEMEFTWKESEPPGHDLGPGIYIDSRRPPYQHSRATWFIRPSHVPRTEHILSAEPFIGLVFLDIC